MSAPTRSRLLSRSWAALALALVATLPLGAARFELSRQDRDRLKKETVYAIDHIQSYHYSQKRFADIDSLSLLDRYMRDLDPARMYLLDKDVDFVKQRFGDTLKPTYLFVGDLYPAFEIYNIFHDRVMSRLAWIDARLNQPLDISGSGTFRPDRKEAAWPTSHEELDALWETRLTFELIPELLADETMERAVNKLRRRYQRMGKFMDEFEVHNVQETFLSSLGQMYDPHTAFFSWDGAQEFNIMISNALVGIGAQLRDIDGYCTIESLIAGGPAEMSGQINPGDKIIEVAQGSAEPVDVVGMKLRKVVQQIRGPAGTEVRLTVIPADSATPRVIPLVREKVELTANLATARIFDVPAAGDRTLRLGQIYLPSFYGEGELGEGSLSTSKDVEELIHQLKDLNMDGLVLDLRDNGGGRLDEAVRLAGLFVTEAPVVMKRSFNGNIETDWDRDRNVAWDGPLVVLVNRNSASASEIVSGALQSWGRAVIVGDESTHGKGTVQAPIDLSSPMRRLTPGRTPQVGMVKVTLQMFYLPNGESTQNRGVVPDIILPSANAFMQEGESRLDNALAWDVIDPARYTRAEGRDTGFGIVSPELLAALRSRTALRRADLPEFEFLARHIEWLRARHDQKEYALNLEQRRLDKDALEAARAAFEKERDRLGEALHYPSTKVELALSRAKQESHQQKLRQTPLPDGSPRANSFYQKVFYYQPDPDSKIHEIWVEYIDFESMLEHSEAIAARISSEDGLAVSADQMRAIITRFRNADRGASFSALRPFTDILPPASDLEAQVQRILPIFFSQLVELKPDILRETPRLDIPLREGLRVLADWVEVESMPAAERQALLARKEPAL
jgi:carboxyl-terminal processing protease